MSVTTASTVYHAPGQADSPVEVKPRYENFIGGHWVPPVQGRYMQDLSPANARKFTEVPRSTKQDIELALDAAHASREAWGETSLTERARVLNRIADVIEEHTEELAVAETWDNGKPVRETLAADIPLAADHFRYFAAETRSLTGSSTEIDKDTVAYHFHEPLGCCDGSLPICLQQGELRIGDGDVLLGSVGGCPVYIDDRQFAVWKHTQLIIDVGPEEPEGFSLPAGNDQHFITRSRVFSPAELATLAEGERQP